jgi:hypothetical protein
MAEDTTVFTATGQAFDQAKEERNWFLYAVCSPKNGSKKRKYPCGMGSPVWPRATTKVANKTYEEVASYLQAFHARRDELLESWRDRVDLETFQIGYLPREGSSLVLVDLDDVLDPVSGELLDGWWSEWLEMYEGYAERSMSGTGLRLVMPRDEGDELLSGASERAGGCFLAADHNKGMALTGDVWRGQGEVGERADWLVMELVSHRDAGRDGRRDGAPAVGEIGDVLLEGREVLDKEQLIDLIRETPNGDDVELSIWIGMVKAVKEYTLALEEATGEDIEEDVLGALEEWTLRWKDGETYDPDRLMGVWREPVGADGRTTLATWFWRRDAGEEPSGDVSGEYVSEEEEEPSGEVSWKRPPVEMASLEDFRERIVMINGHFYDRYTRSYIQGVDHLGNLIARVPFPKPKGVKTHNASTRHAAARMEASRFAAEVFIPQRGMVIEDKELVGGHLVKREGSRLFNRWEPPRWTSSDGREPRTWMDHIVRLFGDLEAELIWDWLALKLRGEKIGIAMVLGGTPGAGKDLLLEPVVNGLAPFSSGSVGVTQLGGDFSGDVIENKTLIVAQESSKAVGGAREQMKREAMMRNLIAIGKPVMLNMKGRRQKEVPNVCDYVFTMNEIDGLYIGSEDRRYMVHYTNAEPVDWWAYQKGHKKDGGDEAVLDWLWKRKVQMRPGQIAPETQSKKRVQLESLRDGLEELVQEVEKMVTGATWVRLDWVLDELWGLHGGSYEKWSADLSAIMRSLGWITSHHWKGGRVRVGRDRVRIWVRQGADVEPEDVKWRLANGENWGRGKVVNIGS